MKGKLRLAASIIQTVIGLLAILSFVVLAIGGEDMSNWVITLVLAVALVILGIINTVDHYKNKS